MNFTNFCEKIVETISKELSTHTVLIKKVPKNNGLELTGLQITSDDAVCISPTIYLEEFFTKYQSSAYTFDEIVTEILFCYNSNSAVPNQLKDSVDKMNDKDYILDNTIVRVVNKDLNNNLLKNVPYLDFLDLAITFRIVISHGSEGLASTQLDNKLFSGLEVDKEELFDIALRNTVEKFPIKVNSLLDTLRQSSDEIIAESWLDDLSFDTDCIKLQIATNLNNLNGATVLLYPEFKNYLNNFGDCYILPSSIHEVLFLKGSDISSDYLKEMVKEVNRTVVSKQDYLSDNVYIYTSESGCIDVLE